MTHLTPDDREALRAHCALGKQLAMTPEDVRFWEDLGKAVEDSVALETAEDDYLQRLRDSQNEMAKYNRGLIAERDEYSAAVDIYETSLTLAHAERDVALARVTELEDGIESILPSAEPWPHQTMHQIYSALRALLNAKDGS